MSAHVLIALVIASAWLVVLTVAVMLCVRQVGALTVRVQLLSVGGAGGSHGSSLGFRINDVLLRLAPELAAGRRVVLLLSANCTTCASVIDQLERRTLPTELRLPEELVVLLPGSEDDTSIAIVASSLRTKAQVLLDPIATTVARGLRMANVPSALLIEDTVITGNLAFVNEVQDIDRMVGSMSLDAAPDEIVETRGSGEAYHS
jgi:hypothetical protein